MNLQPLVDALSGTGNYLIEEKLHSYDLKNKKVIIQFSDPARIWLNGTNTLGSSYTREQSIVFKDEVLASSFIEQVKRIVNYLRATNCKFVMFCVVPILPFETEIQCILTQYKEFLHLVNFNLDLAEDNKHLGPISHTYWAEQLYSHYKNLYM